MTFKKVFSDLEKLIMKADHASLEGEFAFQCCVVGDGEGTFYIAFKDGALDVQPYDYKDNEAVFKADADTYKSILGGEMTAADAVAQGKLTVENNVSGCADILTFLSAKSAPKKAGTTAARSASVKKTAPAAEKKPAAKAEAKPAAKTAVKAEAKEEAPAKKPAGRKPAAASAKKTGGRKSTK